MDASTAVLIGSALATAQILATTWLNHWYTSRRDDAQWDKQQQAEDKKWDRDQQKAEKERNREEEKTGKENRRQLYQRSIQSLSALAAAENEKSKVTLTDDKRLELVEEAHKCISALMLHRPHIDSSNLVNFSRFTEEPGEYAVALRDEIIDIAKQDEVLFSIQKEPSQKPEPRAEEEKALRDIHFYIGDIFRRQQLIKGLELPRTFSFKVNISQLTESQRQKLCDAYFEGHRTIPTLVHLSLPIYVPNAKKIEFNSSRWQAHVNPLASQPSEVFEKWEADYDLALKQAQAELDTDKSSS
jgi:hypothetical protein